MDGVTLLRRARDAGLAVLAEGDKLVIRGPRRAEPVARLLIEHKPAVMAALTPPFPKERDGSVCCECGMLIDECLPTIWGGLACHRACGEAVWRRVAAQGRYW
jgi:hypothetical protein